MLRFRQLLNIVLFDLGYRSIRFGISFYTIWDIVLYDSVNRCPVQPKPGWWVGRGLLRVADHPSRCPRPCRWMFVAATSVTPADGASDWPRCGCWLFVTIRYIVKYVVYKRFFSCFKDRFSMLGVWHLEWGVTLVYINYMEKKFFYFEKKKITP